MYCSRLAGRTRVRRHFPEGAVFILPVKRTFERLSLRPVGWCLVAGAAALLIAVLWLGPTQPAPFLVLDEPYRTPLAFRDKLGRWIPTAPSWSWAWRLEQALFGRRKPLNLSFDVVKLTNSAPPWVSEAALQAPHFSATNGLQAWFLAATQIKALRERLRTTPGAETVTRSKLSTADGVEARLFQGQSILYRGCTNHVGLTVDCFGRVHEQSTDLFVAIQFSEVANNAAIIGADADSGEGVAFRTNLDAAVRLQLPKGNGLFLLDSAPRNANQQRIGLILEPP